MRFDSDIHMTMACIWPRGQCGNGPVTYMSRNRSYRFSFLLMFSVSFVLGLLVILLSASYLFPCLQSLRVTSAVTDISDGILLGLSNQLVEYIINNY